MPQTENKQVLNEQLGILIANAMKQSNWWEESLYLKDDSDIHTDREFYQESAFNVVRATQNLVKALDSDLIEPTILTHTFKKVYSHPLNSTEKAWDAAKKIFALEKYHI